MGIAIVVLLFLLVLYRQFKNWKEAQEQSKEVQNLLEEDENWNEDDGRDTVMDRFDRLLSSPLDNVRRFSNAALVTGIGGTMGIFFIEAAILYLYPPIIDSSIPQGMVIRGAIALFSSLLGVGLHLFISLKILGKAQERITLKEKELDKKEYPSFPKNNQDEVSGEIDNKALSEIGKDLLKELVLLREAMQHQRESSVKIERNVEKLTEELG